MSDVPSAAPAGWFPDGSGQLRYWDGAVWTQHVAPMVQPAAPQAQAPSAAALAAVAATQQAEQAKAARAADAARIQAERAAVAEQQRAAKVAQREAAMQAKAAEREAAARAKAERAAATAAIPVAAAAWPAPTAQVAPKAVAPVIADTRPSRHPATTWVVTSVVALAVLIITAMGGFGGMFVSLGLVALATGLYPLLTGRRSWIPALATRPRSSATAAGAILLLVMGAVVPVAASTSGPRQVDAISASASPTPTSTPTPSATPTPVVHVVEDVSAKSATDARALLREAGYVVQYVLESGGVPSVTDGMTVVSQSPVAGSRVDAGSTVTLTLLTLLAPAPTPTPEPTVAPTVAPAPQPAAPAPAPVAPAPAPAPAAPAPAPAQQTGLIKPGAFCSNADVGTVAQAANGRSYKCGGHGPDANGKNHWNTM
ncbi:PASTA domain-containing protein [Clavibacter sp. VKM Ac-2872]|uniref:PASTA domain-containing protein n=1 Tax=Clavibacter sp. VKM Ac-2872 TaxID=2783812 RepID=UPI001889D62E|nr:PASTA domain-containing protein [Clavibacter sp. VKM Ac-2872]MBF4624592.1 PASTA domain-containing protein [Clavibacter sp. VKM Ac-2872]